LVRDNEQQVYLHANTLTASMQAEHNYDALFRINTLKFMTAPDSVQAFFVDLCLVDCRQSKKPSLTEFKR
jgi:hypothetical protein